MGLDKASTHFHLLSSHFTQEPGQLTLRNLKLKKGVLDKFQLPVDVLEGVLSKMRVLFLCLKVVSGHLGKFELSLHWMNLGNQPVEILIEDVYLLVVPSPDTSSDPEEDEQRVQAAKQERLENAELLHVRGQAEAPGNWVPLRQLHCS